MSGLVTAGIRLVSVADTAGFQQFSGAIRDMRLQFLGFDQINSLIKSTGDALLGFGKAGIKALSSVGDEAVKFDHIMTQVVSIQTSLQPIIGDLSESFLQLSNTLPLSAAELGETAIQAARAGISTKSALESIALTAGKLAAITDTLTEANATKALVTIAKVYDISTANMVTNTEMLGNQLARLEQVGIATAGGIADAATAAAGGAKAFQLSQEHLLALSTAAINTGASAGVAGTAIQNMLLRLAGNSAKASAAVGLNTKRFQEMINAGKGMDALREFLYAVGHNADGTARSTTEMTTAMKGAGIGGKKLGGLVLKLSGNLKFLDEATAATLDSTGMLEKRFQIMASSIQSKLNTLKGSIKNVAIAFGMTLKPLITGVIDAILVFTDIILRIPAPVKFIILAIVGLVSVAALLVGGLLAAVAVFTALATGAMFLGKALLSAKASMGVLRSETDSAARAMNKLLKAQLRLAAAGPADTLKRRRARFAEAGGQIRLDNIVKGSTFGTLGKDLALVRYNLQALPMAIKNGGMAQALRSALSPLLGTASAGASAAASGGVFATIGAVAGPIFSSIAAVALPVAAVMVAIGVAVIALKDDIEGLFDAFMGLFDPVKMIFERLGAIGKKVSGGEFSLISGFFSAMRASLFPFVMALKATAFYFRVLTQVGMTFVETVFTGLEPLVDMFMRFKLAMTRAWSAIVGMAESLGLISKEGSFLTTVLGVIGDAVAHMMLPLRAAIWLLNAVLGWVMVTLIGIAQGILVAFEPVFLELQALKMVFVTLWNDLAASMQPLMAAWDSLKESLGATGVSFDFFGIAVQAFAFVIRVVLQPIIFGLRFAIKLLALSVKFLIFLFEPLIFVFKVIAHYATKLIKWLGEAAQMMSFLFGAGDGMSNRVKMAFKAMGDAVVKALSAPLRWIQNFFDFLMEGLDKFSTFVSSVFSGELFKSKDFKAGLDQIVGYISAAPGAVVGAVFAPVKWAITAVMDAFSFFGDKVGNVFDWVLEKAEPLLPYMGRFLKTVGKLMGAWTKLFAPFRKGIEFLKYLFTSWGDTVGSVFDRLVDAFKRFFDFMTSPKNLLKLVIFGPSSLGIPSLAKEGYVKGSGVANIHRGEVVAKLSNIPEIAARTSSLQSTFGPRLVSSSPGTSTQSITSGSPNLSITIPVTVTLDGSVIGTVLARVSEEEVRQQLGTRGVRLAGIG